MRTYQHTAFTVLDRYDTLLGGFKSDAGVGSGLRRQFLDPYEFHFTTTLWNVFEVALRDLVLFSAVQTVLSTLYV
jgi:hypothetical protein